jgi:hypothetical protein
MLTVHVYSQWFDSRARTGLSFRILQKLIQLGVFHLS